MATAHDRGRGRRRTREWDRLDRRPGSRRKPMSLVRAILQRLTDLHIVSYGGPDVGILTAAGKCCKVTYRFVSLDSILLEPHFRAVRQGGLLPDFMDPTRAPSTWPMAMPIGCPST